jgi:hypothetical protein
MQRRQITLEDGRYLIFYTFDEETTAASSTGNAGDEKSSAREEEPNAEPQATEERRV